MQAGAVLLVELLVMAQTLEDVIAVTVAGEQVFFHATARARLFHIKHERGEVRSRDRFPVTKGLRRDLHAAVEGRERVAEVAFIALRLLAQFAKGLTVLPQPVIPFGAQRAEVRRKRADDEEAERSQLNELPAAAHLHELAGGRLVERDAELARTGATGQAHGLGLTEREVLMLRADLQQRRIGRRREDAGAGGEQVFDGAGVASDEFVKGIVPKGADFGRARILRLPHTVIADGLLVSKDPPRGFVVHQLQDARDVVLVYMRDVGDINFAPGLAQSSEGRRDMREKRLLHASVGEQQLAVIALDEQTVAFVGLEDGGVHTVRSLRSKRRLASSTQAAGSRTP